MTQKTTTPKKSKPAKTRLLGQTPSQTVGPFFAYGLTPEQYGYPWTAIADSNVATAATQGDHIRIEGRVIDGKGDVVRDAMIEIRQADAAGRFTPVKGSNAGFTGFGRCGTGTDPDGRWFFNTIKPGKITAQEAPRIDVIVTMRGMLLHAFTRIYFMDEATANKTDPVLMSVPAARRKTLLAQQTKPGVYVLDIHMQGKSETVFFDL
jgi:protocatechuate 3,4-dioxygenase, alpha subunit